MLSERTRVAALVPTVRPALLDAMLRSWRDCPTVHGNRHIDLHVLAQREPAEEFDRVLAKYPASMVTRYEYRPSGGPVWPVRAGYMRDHHGEADVWVLCDDDFELLPGGVTDWWPAVGKVTSDPLAGVVSCGWARSEADLPNRWPVRGALWGKQPIVNMSGGMVFRSEVGRLMARDADVPWMFDDTMVAVTSYLAGLENWRFRGSVLIHRILSPGGVAVVFQSTVLRQLDERWVVPRRAKAQSAYRERDENLFYIPTSADVTAAAREQHKVMKRRRASVLPRGTLPRGTLNR